MKACESLTYHQGQRADDEDDGHEDEQDEMLHLLGHGRRPALAVGPGGRRHRAAAPPPPPEHPEQLVHHEAVARHCGQHQHQHERGVQVGVHPVPPQLGVHVNEAPRPGAVLDVFTEPGEGEETE